MPDTAPATAPDTLRSFVERLHLHDLYSLNSLHNWLFLTLALLISLALGRIFAFLFARVAKRLEARKWHARACLFSGAIAPLFITLFALGISVGLAQLVMPPALEDFAHRTILLLVLIAVAWYIYNLVDLLDVAIGLVAHRHDGDAATLNSQIVPILRRTLRALIVSLAALSVLQTVFQYDVAALITGLGIAGLAVSLAAQDSLKNLFGSLTILFDRPFLLGHRIKCQGFDGSVEEIGFRSTKIRTGDGTIVTIPNSVIVNDPVENFAARPRIHRTLNIPIPFDTPAEKVRQALQILHDLLQSPALAPPIHDDNPARNLDPPRAFFTDFNPATLTLQVHYWFRPASDYWAYLAHAQQFNLALMDAFAAIKLDFATPTQTLLLTPGPTSNRTTPSQSLPLPSQDLAK